MDYGYMGRILLSISIFAPGLIMFLLLAAVGTVMLFESFTKNEVMIDSELFGENPAPGRIISEMEADMNSEEKTVRKIGRK